MRALAALAAVLVSGSAATFARQEPGPEEQVAAGEVDAAIAALRSRRDADPSALRYLAFLEQRRGDYGACVATASRVLALDPDDAQARLQRAYAHWLDGALEAARLDLEVVADRTGEGEEGGAARASSERARADLESLRSQISRYAALTRAEQRLHRWFVAALVGLALALAATLRTSLRRDL